MKWGANVVLQIGSNMACFIKSKDNSTKGILNLLEFSICYIYSYHRIGNCSSHFDYRSLSLPAWLHSPHCGTYGCI